MEGLLCTCGMVYTNQRVNFTPVDPLREYHPDHFYALPSAFKAAWVARHCPPGRLLEIGCGSGFFLERARHHGYEVVGLEPNPAYDQELEQQGLRVLRECLENTTLPRRSFDVVYHCDLLAHFVDPIKALSAMCNLLSPQGVLCFEVGLLGGLSPWWYSLVGTLGLGQHLWLYSDLAFKKLMREVGLEMVHIQYFGLAPEVLGSKFVGILNKRLVMPVCGAFSAKGRDSALAAQHSIRNFLRYRVGSFVPHIGPQTLLVVAKPIHAN